MTIFKFSNIKLRLFTDPIPGGCNMEFAVPTSPYMQVSYNKNYILVDAAMAKDFSDKTCNTIDKVVVLFYKVYLPERNFDEDSYFDGIKSLMTLDNIKDFGEYVSIIYFQENLLH